MNKKMLIRTHASEVFGLGHLRRCIDIHRSCKKNGIDSFLVASGSHGSWDFFKKFKLKKIVWVGEDCRLDNDVNFIKKEGIESGIIDVHPDLLSFFEDKIRSSLNRMLIIESGSKALSRKSDVVINPNFLFIKEKNKHYDSLKIKSFLGMKYFIVSEDLQKIHQKKSSNSSITKVLVVFGGGDVDNKMMNIMEYVSKLKLPGASFSFLPSPSTNPDKNFSFNSKSINCNLLRSTTSIGSVLVGHDLVVATNGNIAYEAMVLNKPLITLSVNKMQELQAVALGKLGVSVYMGSLKNLKPKELLDMIMGLRRNEVLINKMVFKQRDFVDSGGLDRVMEIISENL